MSHSKSSDRDRHRDRSPDRRRSRRSESRSPGPSRYRQAKKGGLPTEFGRSQQEQREDDNLNILQRMEDVFDGTPLYLLNDSMQTKRLIKVWTRNYKEVRGIITGYVDAFDKHWNIVINVTEEVGLLPKKCKVPFLRDIEPDDDIPEFPVKVPKVKKSAEVEVATEKLQDDPPNDKTIDGEGKKKKRRRSKKKKKRVTPKLLGKDLVFVRGDNIVMITYKEVEKTTSET